MVLHDARHSPSSSPAVADRFSGQIVVVTGATGGIGSAMCQRFADEGAHVVMVDMAAPTEVHRPSGAPGSTEQLAADLSSTDACHDAVARVLARHGEIDVLVNNAGINRRGDVLALTEEDWRATYRVNVDAIFDLCRAVLPGMVERGRGVVVNTASQWGLHPAAGHVAYNSSKAAVVSLTQSMARDVGRHGIRVNAICPGEILTPMVEQNLRRTGRTEEDLASGIPLGRLGRPKDVAALAAFLASDDASFVSGSAVEITGAQSVA